MERLIYVGDPMCSWCWGFAPVLERLVERAALPVDVVVGGLRPEEAAQELDTLRPFLHREWARIAERTGQPFDPSILDRPGWRYDTMTADMAVVAMRQAAPEATLPFFVRLQRAFYAEAVDVTDPAAYGRLVAGFPADADAFVERLTNEELRTATRLDFQRARWLGAEGFPTLFLASEGRHVPVAVGYAPIEVLEARLDSLRS